MIAAVKELKCILHMLEEAKNELKGQGIQYDSEIRVGIMAEVPSAVVMLDMLAKYLDFVSIGSNDLTQYVMAADRLNKNVGYLYNYMDPAVLRLIKHTIDTADEKGVECSLCGEMAGEALGLAALMALGLKKFSVSPSLGLITKRRISLLNAAGLAETGRRMLKAEDACEAAEILKSALPEMYFEH
jgi:phosphotransferase system enzyme I (PtsI)